MLTYADICGHAGALVDDANVQAKLPIVEVKALKMCGPAEVYS